MNLGLSEKVILVTGGGSGVGAGITRACLAEGAHVVIAGRVTDIVMEFMGKMRETGARCELIPAELGREEECAAIVEKTLAHHGRLDGLVNNAGVNDRIGLEHGSPAAFNESLRHNLVHYYTLAHHAVPALRSSRGAIVNIGSKVAFTGQGGTSAYAAAKGAQLALTRELGGGAAALRYPRERNRACRGDDAALPAVDREFSESAAETVCDRRLYSPGAPDDNPGGDRLGRGISAFSCALRAHHRPAYFYRWGLRASRSGHHLASAAYF